MAVTNHERVGKALELLNKGILPFIERELKAKFKSKWTEAALDSMKFDDKKVKKGGAIRWDTQTVLSVMWNHWNDVFGKVLGPTERSIISELREIRNRWAHQNSFSTDDAYRAIDSVHRLLTAVAAIEAQEADKMKQQLLRVRFDEQARSQTRKETAVSIKSATDTSLKPWREIATPHDDVASGRYQQAEFAADLSQVYRGEGVVEYSNPEEFFRRTYPTVGLQDLLSDTLLRLSGKGGNPVIKLQTNFGGGKTHSMIALYHLFSGTPATQLAGIEQIMETTEVQNIPRANRAVLVGIALGPAQATKKKDGTVVNTMWGEMAWQLLGKKGYKLVDEADKKGVSPGSDKLRELFNQAAPCLVLIDEWIAYVRMLYGKDDMPAGSFDANLTFAQALTEAARAAKQTQVVATIPISPRVSDQHREQIEIGGEAGREALARLEHVFARMESPWRPASAEESFEIVRRRLFKTITDHVSRDATVRRFSELYRDSEKEFPQGCKEVEYKRRMEMAYPIHPELFDRLYQDWASMERFQLTRGVLRLMAAVIHSLWERNDANVMIMPCMVPLEDDNVRKELLRYLAGPWDSVIDRDIDGPNSIALALDRDNPNLGKISANRRVARTIFIGSAPTVGAANRGLEDRRIKLGCTQPGESAAIFGDALRRLTDQATHLYVDKGRYWFATQPSVTRLAQDRATQHQPDVVFQKIKERLLIQQQPRNRGDFIKVHPSPENSADVPDEMGVRLVIFGPEHYHVSKEEDSPALRYAKDILENRGTIPRNYKNTLIFMAPDGKLLQDLDAAMRQYLAWESIVKEEESLNLDAFQRNQAKTKKKEADETIDQRIPEAYQWALVPYQSSPQSSVEWQAIRVTGNEVLAIKASAKLKREEHLITIFAGIRLRMEMDKIPLWRGEEKADVEIRQLAEDFFKYIYLPRLKSIDTLTSSVEDGLKLTTWSTESFAFANGYDIEKNRYIGLKAGQSGLISADGPDLLVHPHVALTQMEEERVAPPAIEGATTDDTGGITVQPGEGAGEGGAATAEKKKLTRRFFGSVELDSARVGRDAGRIAEEVIQHLSGLVKSDVRITLEIEADIPEGVPDNVVRTVTENCRTLNFKDHGFEEE